MICKIKDRINPTTKNFNKFYETGAQSAVKNKDATVAARTPIANKTDSEVNKAENDPT